MLLRGPQINNTHALQYKNVIDLESSRIHSCVCFLIYPISFIPSILLICQFDGNGNPIKFWLSNRFPIYCLNTADMKSLFSKQRFYLHGESSSCLCSTYWLLIKLLMTAEKEHSLYSLAQALLIVSISSVISTNFQYCVSTERENTIWSSTRIQ